MLPESQCSGVGHPIRLRVNPQLEVRRARISDKLAHGGISQVAQVDAAQRLWFVVGVQGADAVIAINSDPETPICVFADDCNVGDVFRVVPALTAALRATHEVSYA